MLTREAKPVTADFVCSATHSGPFFVLVFHTLSPKSVHIKEIKPMDITWNFKQILIGLFFAALVNA